MNSQEAARLAFGNPGFFDFLAPLAKPFKAIAPVLSLGASFLPFGGLVSKAIDYAAGAIQDDASAVHQAVFPSQNDAEDDSLGNDGDY